MSFLGKESKEILVAGHQKVMYRIDVEQGYVSKEVNESRSMSNVE